MQLVIEIFEGKNTPLARNVTTKSGPKTFYHVPAAVDTGGLYPVEFRFPVESENHFITPGKYTLPNTSFKVGPYGDLEIDRFNMLLVPIKG